MNIYFETWLDEKIMNNKRDNIIVKLGINQLRINFYEKYYYISKTEDSVKAYDSENVEFFVDKINTIQRTKPNRKVRRANTKMYKKYMNLIKKASKKNADVISNEICDKIASENAINNPESTIEEIKSETKDNIKNALNIEKSEENNG